jgi:hypothetical protein
VAEEKVVRGGIGGDVSRGEARGGERIPGRNGGVTPGSRVHERGQARGIKASSVSSFCKESNNGFLITVLRRSAEEHLRGLARLALRRRRRHFRV